MKFLVILGVIASINIGANIAQSFTGQCEKIKFTATIVSSNHPIEVEGFVCKEQGKWRIK